MFLCGTIADLAKRKSELLVEPAQDICAGDGGVERIDDAQADRITTSATGSLCSGIFSPLRYR